MRSNHFQEVAERFRGSLFAVPMTMVVAGIVMAQIGITVDGHLDVQPGDFPLGVTSTEQSARAVLSTIAGATITVAGIAFSVAILTIQLASSQFSPRVVGSLFRDPFNKRVIGIVAGTFAYCLVVLRSVRAPLEQQGSPVIPNISVTVGLVLGIVAILAIIAFINHSAHAISISEILDSVTGETLAAVDHSQAAFASPEPSVPALLDVLPRRPGFHGPIREPGMGSVPRPDGPTRGAPGGQHRPARHRRRPLRRRRRTGVHDLARSRRRDGVARRALRAITTGPPHTIRQDVAFGSRQIVDVALKALSPGIDDATTARDAIWHLATVLHRALNTAAPDADLYDGHHRLVLTHVADHRELIALAYREVRAAAAPMPAVCMTLVESIADLVTSLDAPPRAVVDDLAEQARLVVVAARTAGPDPVDLAWLEQEHQRRFLTSSVT